MSSDALSEESSVCERAGYNETFGSGDESEDFLPSSEREASTQSLDGEDERYAEGSEEVGVDEVGVTVVMMMTVRMVMVMRRMMERSLVKGPH